MKILTLLCFLSLVLFASKLTRSGDYIIDDQNKLMWQDSLENVKIILTQEHSLEYCKKLNFGGFSDWRLPNIEEYNTIIDKKRIVSQPQINKAFKYIKQDDYWASDRTWIRNFGLYGYYVFFKSGSVYYQNRTYPKYVRCVRSLK
ncbi:MAG: DUF1566 domain-containing protein [Arcobacteraceae bacterium]